ncbi:MAG: hypothetical protein JSW39_01140 [Desulfobacterales bacterium]|nr:MAG: hypothetical protein JSW39_01140 [Desulfobacterales bacterium]
MKDKMMFWAILFLVFGPMAVNAGNSVPFTIEGVIGDFAPKSGIYEIDGKIYRLPPNIIIENHKGQQLTVRHLTGGTFVKVIGKKILDLSLEEQIKFYKIVVTEKY